LVAHEHSLFTGDMQEPLHITDFKEEIYLDAFQTNLMKTENNEYEIHTSKQDSSDMLFS
jgi:hypothetical protein